MDPAVSGRGGVIGEGVGGDNRSMGRKHRPVDSIRVVHLERIDVAGGPGPLEARDPPVLRGVVHRQPGRQGHGPGPGEVQHVRLGGVEGEARLVVGAAGLAGGPTAVPIDLIGIMDIERGIRRSGSRPLVELPVAHQARHGHRAGISSGHLDIGGERSGA